MSKKYVIDTNVLYGLVFNDGHCKANNASDILNKNIGIVTYGTLFEAFDRYRNQKENLLAILKFINNHKFVVAGNSTKEDDLFWLLLYSEKELSDLGLMVLKRLLVIQTSDYVSRVLGQVLNAFAILYMNMRLNKEYDAFNAYVSYSSLITDGFSHFPVLVREFFDKIFSVSYTQNNSQKFIDILRKEFWGIIRSVETHYIVLSRNPIEFIKEEDFTEALANATESFDKQYSEKKYLDFISDAHKKLETGEKFFTNDSDLFSNIDYQELTDLEKDFLKYCIQRLFVKQGKFKYNDIIDFMNLSTALRYADGLMTCDKQFLKKTAATFDSIIDSECYKNSLQIFDMIST